MQMNVKNTPLKILFKEATISIQETKKNTLQNFPFNIYKYWKKQPSPAK